MKRTPDLVRRSIVEDLRGGRTRAQVARNNHVSESLVSRIGREEGITSHHNVWTPEEVAFLRENYWEMGATKIAKVLTRHPNRISVAHKAGELGLRTRVGPYGKLRVIEGGRGGKEA